MCSCQSGYALTADRRTCTGGLILCLCTRASEITISPQISMSALPIMEDATRIVQIPMQALCALAILVIH